MKVRKRILLLTSLLLLVSVGGIVNLMWQLPRMDQIHDPKTILQLLILLGLFGTGLAFSILELFRQEIRSPIIQLTAQVARLKERQINRHRLGFTGSRDIDLLTRTLNDLLDGYEKEAFLYRIFTEVSPDMIFLLDKEGCVLFGNHNATRQWNYQPEEIIGKRQEELFPPDIAERHKQVIKKIFETGQPVSVDVHEMIGERHSWIDARMIPVLDKDGGVTAVLGISRDISERKQAEEELLLHAEITRNISEGIALIRVSDAIIVYTNPKFEKMFGYGHGELIGKNISVINAPSDESPEEVAGKIKKSLRKKTEWQGEVYNIKKDGTLFWCYANVSTFSHYKYSEVWVAVHTDITERKRVEDVLRVSELRYREIFAGTPDGIIIHDANGVILDANEAMAQRLEIAREALPGRKLAEFITPENAANIGEHATKAMMGVKQVFETTYVSASGKMIPAEVHEHGIPWRNGQAVLSISRDITERKQVENAQRESEAKFKALLAGAPEGIIVLDLQANQFRYANPTICRMLGYTEEELLRLSIADIHPKGKLDQVLAEFKAQVRGEKTLVHDLPCLRKDGALFYANVSGIKIVLNDRECNVSFFTDITEHKKEHEALRESENKYRQLVETLQEGVWLIDKDANTAFVNPRMAEMLGYSVEEMVGKSLFNFMDEHGVEIAKRNVERRKQGIAEQHDFEFVRKDGSRIYTILLTMPMTDEKGNYTGVLASIMDITERKKTDEELHLRRQELFHMQRFKSMGELASSLAHEINQPLAGILSNAQAAQRFLAGTEPDLGQIREILADIVADDKRAGAVIQRLRALLRKEEAPRESIDINKALQNVIALVHDEAIGRNVTLHSELAKGLPQVCVDRIQIEQIILNLIMNAVQAMKNIAVHKRNIVVSTVQGTPAGVVVSVRDTGPGIAKDKLEQIFEPFYTTRAGGLGLGLSICRSILAAHGGRIWAENNPDGGARFCFWLPAAEKTRKAEHRKQA